MSELSICRKCGGIVNYDPYFKAYVCSQCGNTTRYKVEENLSSLKRICLNDQIIVNDVVSLSDFKEVQKQIKSIKKKEGRKPWQGYKFPNQKREYRRL